MNEKQIMEWVRENAYDNCCGASFIEVGKLESYLSSLREYEAFTETLTDEDWKNRQASSVDAWCEGE